MDEPDFRALFESQPGRYLVLRPDAPRYTIVAVTDGYARATMTRRVDILGRGLFEVFPDNPADPQADGVRNLRASLGRVIAEGCSDAMAVQKYDVRRPQEQGGGFEERWWSPVNSPVFDGQGRLSCILHRVEDVTDYLRLRHHGDEQEKRAEELRARTARIEVEVIERARELQSVNERLRAANEEASRLYARTLELDRLKTQFFANVSHELRTPLTLILAPVHGLLASPAVADPGMRRDLEVIERNARTLLRHVEDLLDLARLEEDGLKPACEALDAAALARLVAGHFSAAAAGLAIELRVQVPPQLPACSDAGLLQRVLFNLLSNAFKFTPAGSVVRLSLERRDGRMHFEVADGGPGIPAEWREAVFDRFRQVGGDARRWPVGTGLGLAIAKEFVLLLGGAISVADAPEGGALLVVELPLDAAAPPRRARPAVAQVARGAAAGAPASQPAAPDLHLPLVLVVEDNADMRRYIGDSLAGQCRIASAGDGVDGLQQALALRPDLVLTDIMLPVQDGEWLLRQLRARPELADTPVVVLSARADDEMRVRLLRQGAQDCLTKPFAVEELRARVAAPLARAAALASLRSSEEYWREVFVQASDGLLIGDPDCNAVLDANEAACQLFGRSRAELVGSGPRDWLVVDDPGSLPDFQAALHAGRTLTTPWVVRRGDGGRVQLEVAARQLSDGRCLAVLRDATLREQQAAASRALTEELERRVGQRTEQLRRLAADLEAAESRERRQIARDLHDDLGQVLAATRIRLAALCRHPRADVRRAAAEIAALVEQANQSTRSLAAQLAPAVLYELGLVPALEWLAEEVSTQFGLAVQIDDDGQPKPLSQEARSIVYRAVRELLINVAKHAGVASARVWLTADQGWLGVTVGDGGVGFAAEPSGQPSRGLGLITAAERLSFVGGSFAIRSIPGDGTEATLRVPLDPEQDSRKIPV